MPTAKRPRRGSLQFWPRKRASKVLPSANWNPISSKEQGLLGFVGYKAGMSTAIVKDGAEKTTTAKKQIATPVTVLEVPNMKIYSVRFYKHKKPLSEIVVSNDKELKKKLRAPKTAKTLDKVPEGYDDIRVIVYSLAKQTSVKKTPDVIEIGVQADDKLEYVKSLIGKEISLADVLHDKMVDVRGVTKGKGTQGPVKRFGITLRFHKSEKGVRKVGSIAPWHPARVTYRTPMAGQMGLFTRIIYNLHVLGSGKIAENDINPANGFKDYGKIKTSYILLKGSVQGPAKRQILITPALRPSKVQTRRNYELMEVMK